MKNLLIIFFLLFHTKSFADNYVKLTKSAMHAFCQKMKNEKAIFTIGDGGAMMDDVKSVFFHFISHDQLKLQQARRVYVEMVEVFLKRINEDIALRPYLHTYPFDIKNIEILLSFRSDNNERPAKEYLALVHHHEREDIILYDAYDSNAQEFFRIHEEPYQLALQIVKDEGYLDTISYLELPKRRMRRAFSR